MCDILKTEKNTGDGMKKILTVFGTRPEAIKMCPLVIELKKRSTFSVSVCSTGQHREMMAPALELFGVVPDIDLDIMRPSQTLFDISAATLEGVRRAINDISPDIVAVHGDTTTAFAAALAAFYSGVPVAHVEAGLRTYDISSPYPEEFNRGAIDKIARWCFAPTERSADNLRREGKKESEIFVVGNTAIDALKYTASPSYTNDVIRSAAGKRLITVTAHRRENIGNNMKNMFGAIRDIINAYPDVMIYYPVHKNPEVRALAAEHLDGCERIVLCEPMDVVGFHSLLSHSYLVLTDSGGIQEEAPSLGCPVVVMRNTTERPEAVEAGTAVLAGTGRHEIFAEVSHLLSDDAAYGAMKNAKNPFGDGRTSEKIATIFSPIGTSSASNFSISTN